jgi:hypothetical protein
MPHYGQLNSSKLWQVWEAILPIIYNFEKYTSKEPQINLFILSL